VTVCPECRSLDIGYTGFGTEFIETEVKAKIPAARIDRLDIDNLKHKGELAEKLAAFRNGDIDILLGTQMVAKGLNFPRLKVVGVVLADTGLTLPDFRAGERTFALITQVAGRTGRFFPDGKVIVQSFSPEREAVALACSGNIEEFYRQELAQREMLRFPPFSRLIRLVFRSASQQKAAGAASGAAEILAQEAAKRGIKGVEIMGPSECALEKIAANYRMQILLRARQTAGMQNLCASFLYGYKPPYGVYIEVDTDPVSLL
jgi:primosomal protein N' (replication factor Y)